MKEPRMLELSPDQAEPLSTPALAIAQASDSPVDLPTARKPVLSFEAEASRLGARRLTELHGKGYQVVRAGTEAEHVQSRLEPGVTPLLKLVAGQRYSVELFKVKGSNNRKDAPADRASAMEAIFYTKAWPAMPFIDEADGKRLREDYVVLVTEGLRIRVEDASRLEEYGLYKAVVRRLD